MLLTRRYASTFLTALRGTLLVLFWPSAALAHDKWLEVEPAVSAQPAAVKVYVATGEALKQVEYVPERRAQRIATFELRTAAGSQNLATSFRTDAQPIATLPPLPIGTSLLRLDTAPVEIELPAEKFSAYLLEERLIDVLAERKRRAEEDAVGRERYSRSLKALVQVGNKLDPVVTQPVGQTLEIVPMSNPLGLRARGTLAIQILFQGQPLSGCAVAVTQRFRSRVQESYQRSDGAGVVRVPVEPRGQWLVHLVYMHRAEAGDAAAGIDWRSHWASLSFSYADPAQ